MSTRIDLNLLNKNYLTKNNFTYFTSWLNRLRCENESYQVVSNNKNIEINNVCDTKIDKNIDKYYIYNKKNILFWIFYILNFGYDEYTQLDKLHIFSIENNIRFKLIDELNDKIEDIKIMCKKYKIKYNSVIQNLGNNEDLDMDTFKIICILKGLNIIFKRYTFIEIMNNSDNNNFYCVSLNSRLNTNHKTQSTTKIFNYTLTKMDNETINDILNNSDKMKYIIVNNIEKAVKSISSYKLAELQEISKQMEIDTYITTINKSGIETKKNKKKQELYQEIIERI